MFYRDTARTKKDSTDFTARANNVSVGEGSTVRVTTMTPTPPKKCPKCGSEMANDRQMGSYTEIARALLDRRSTEKWTEAVNSERARTIF